MTQYRTSFSITDNQYTIRHTCFCHTLTLGQGKKYGVWKDQQAYLLVEVEQTSNPFDTIHLFSQHLYIGNGDTIFVVNLLTLDYQTIPVDLYFGYFYEVNCFLFAASATRVLCFGENGKRLWQTPQIAVDGITFQSWNKKILKVSCCMDPCPALWIEQDIFL
ncbi:MAG: hypothetical protein IKM28_08215 [Lachnospiraceae bacterium]|nr:hypothetical protein [Lachnospiraceae bacterium]